jgi:hypothetical protein
MFSARWGSTRREKPRGNAVRLASRDSLLVKRRGHCVHDIAVGDVDWREPVGIRVSRSRGITSRHGGVHVVRFLSVRQHATSHATTPATSIPAATLCKVGAGRMLEARARAERQTYRCTRLDESLFIREIRIAGVLLHRVDPAVPNGDALELQIGQ